MAHIELSRDYISPAFQAVEAAKHPSPMAGGPCLTCAFRPGTEANSTERTFMLAQMCVEGVEPFDCHEQPQACRGWIAAVNLREAAGEINAAGARHREAMRLGADILSRCITAAKHAEEGR